LTRRLMSNIREDKGYTYGISAGIMPYPDSGLLVGNLPTVEGFDETKRSRYISECMFLRCCRFESVVNERPNMVARSS
ncbi:hypothetical protein, partial [Bacteroides cellulosilyticus]|uniref:hypothetical protein n=1 Tax=Bacteroides cellulosilyticus TaxID=246787 RepID=UPI0023B04B52